MSTVELTVAICTYNRAEMLRDTLESLTRMRVPDDLGWELLVVANACTDHTDAVIADFLDALPLQGIHESTPGKSHAANAAVRRARGTHVVWTDDDVLVCPEWLSAYREAIRAHPDTAVFGGPIEARFEGDPPRWVHEVLRADGRIWAAIDTGPDPVPVTVDRIPLGANMALRRDAHLRHPFDVRIGPRPTGEIRGEETQVIQALLADGERGLWIPEARVLHRIPPERQTLRYYRRFFEGLGQTDATLAAGGPAHLLGRPAWAWRQAVACEAAYRFWRLLGVTRRWLDALRHGAYARGVLRGPAASDGG